ncbi:MAG: hypothetical protein P8179_15035 [Candidatus Thiodiazotropha sp.]
MSHTNLHYIFGRAQCSLHALLVVLFLLAQSATLLHAKVLVSFHYSLFYKARASPTLAHAFS